ncbi:pseudouridine synthase, partial [Streptococcus sp. DD10]|uniref:pseudouridine synthase n=1 Tax=Streptococcus sp. DD10 TaxID=1777878 RepID=UPI00082A7E05
MRLDNLLAQAGFGGRNHIKKLIRSRQVLVDGQPATQDSQIVDTGLQEISVAGQKVEGYGSRYYLLNKPAGVVTARSDKEHQTVLDLIAPKDRVAGLYPIGRLDRDTKGLLLITNNGPLGYRMLHPSHHVDKMYEVIVNGLLTEDSIYDFARGIVFHDGTICKPAQMEILYAREDKSLAHVTISEGKFHQIKKMFLCIGLKVISLTRLSFGDFILPADLHPGQYRVLNDDEKKRIKRYL